jgi:hypothetical protein
MKAGAFLHSQGQKLAFHAFIATSASGHEPTCGHFDVMGAASCLTHLAAPTSFCLLLTLDDQPLLGPGLKIVQLPAETRQVDEGMWIASLARLQPIFSFV